MKPSLNHLFILVALALAGAASFFTFRVVELKRSLKSGAGTQVMKSGMQVPVTRVLDGDEVVVQVGADLVTVRILGLSTFDPTMNDPQVQPLAQQALRFLERSAQGQAVELVFEELRFDARKRLLAYVHRGSEDLGQRMIQEGYGLAYTRFPASRLGTYVLDEDRARRERRGLWGEPGLAQRATQLRTLWDLERTRGE